MKELPDNWGIDTLQNCLETIESGGRPKGGAIEDTNEIPSLGAEHLNDEGRFNFKKIKYIPREYFKTIDKGIIEKNDILIVKDGATTGKTAFVEEKFPYDEAAVNEHLFIIRTKKYCLFPKYAFYYIYSPYGNRQVMRTFHGSAQGGIIKSFVKQVKIPLPPLPVQLRIAAILEKADALRQKHKKVNNLSDQFLQSVFLEMFGDPIKNLKGWKRRKLGSLCIIRRGGSPRPIKKYLGGTVPWIKIGDGTKGSDIYINETSEKIIEDGVKKSVLLKAGSLIFANCGVSLGFARIIKIDGCIHDGWLSMENIDPTLNKIFLLKSLNSISNYFRKTAPDGTQPNLNTKIMKNFELPIPPINIQNKFANIVERFEKIKDTNNINGRGLNNLFSSLLQSAFTGELTAKWEEEHRGEIKNTVNICN